MNDKPVKPLGRKAYGSIGHIATSRLGPADHSVSPGESDICTLALPTENRWRVYAQTKLDGSCVAVAKLDDGSIVPLGRAGYPASASPFPMHHLFHDWVIERSDLFDALLDPGERVVGEWLAQAHGTRYDLDGRDPFVAFDIMTGSDRVMLGEFMDRVGDKFEFPSFTSGPIEPHAAMAELDGYGAEVPEGVVYRAEASKNGKPWRTMFLAKWVRPGKIDGELLDDENPVWNWRP